MEDHETQSPMPKFWAQLCGRFRPGHTAGAPVVDLGPERFVGLFPADQVGWATAAPRPGGPRPANVEPAVAKEWSSGMWLPVRGPVTPAHQEFPRFHVGFPGGRGFTV